MGSRVFWGLIFAYLAGVLVWSFWFVRLPLADSSLAPQVGKRVTVYGRVVNAPDVRDRGTNIEIQPRDATTKILAHVQPHILAVYGDAVRVTGILKTPRFSGYWASRGVSYELVRARVQYVGPPSLIVLPQRWAFAVKQLFLDGLARTLPSPEDGVAAGITVGYRRSIGDELTKEMERTGLIHIVTLSGYNITMMLRGLRALLQQAPPWAARSASIGTITLLLALSGGASSAVRSCLMAYIAVYARESKRTFHALRAAGLVCFAMVLWDPYLLAFDPGFQLSTAGTFGLIIFTPIIDKRISWLTQRYGLREIVSSTLATQFAVSPLLLLQDGFVSWVSLPANIVILVILPLTMVASLIASIGGVLFGFGGVVFALPAHLLLAYIIAVTHFFAAL